ncbi:MAG TPA: hypothetical protein VLZ28_05935, partial [Daejeonella sp.]|nr:hypothetical protein [Daejeonella sp.]
MKIAVSILMFAMSLMFSHFAKAQNLTKEATNAFAHFTKTQEIKQLEAARKNIDEAFKTGKDSLSLKNNLLRAMIYSALAVVDSNRNFNYEKDPLQVASYSLNLLNNKKFNAEFEAEIEFIKNQLSRGYLFEANNAVTYSDFEEAVFAFAKVDSLSPGDLNITHNLAVLY